MHERLASLRLGRIVIPILFGGGFAAVAARASAGCPVIVTPKDAPQAWAEAGRNAARQLSDDSPYHNDCKEVRVEVGSDETLVILSTRDARSATRPIRTPEQLEATIAALASTTLALPETAPIPADVSKPAGPAAAPPVRPPVAPTPTHVLINALGGARLGFPGHFNGADLELSAGLTIGLGEIGMFVDGTPSMSTSADTPDGFTMWAARTGIRGGLRAPAGPVSILAGALLGVGMVNETAPNPDARVGEINSYGSAVAEPLFGAYAGAAWPNASSVRLRAQVAVDGVLSRLGHTLNLDMHLPDLPSWSMAMQIGIEVQPL
jgi:hypothetical protein